MEQTTTPAQPAAAQDHVREQPQQPAPTTTQQPWDLPKPEPYKPGRIFGIAKLVLGGLNIVFAIIVLGIGIDILVDPATYEPYVGVFILTIAVSFLRSLKASKRSHLCGSSLTQTFPRPVSLRSGNPPISSRSVCGNPTGRYTQAHTLAYTCLYGSSSDCVSPRLPCRSAFS